MHKYIIHVLLLKVNELNKKKSNFYIYKITINYVHNFQNGY